MCPVVGWWPLHGCELAYYLDDSTESHVLEVGPVGVPEEDRPEGNGHHQTDKGLLYELAEFEFGEIMKEVPLEHPHFSQRRQIFEIGWNEGGQDLELRVDIVPIETDDKI